MLHLQSRVIANTRNSNTPRHRILGITKAINPADGSAPAVDVPGTGPMQSTLRIIRDIRRAKLETCFAGRADTV